MAAVDWGHLAYAINFWEARGHHYIDVPWIVSPRAAKITFPTYRSTLGEALVGSAEQSFIQMMLDGTLERTEREITRALSSNAGRWVSCSPCFRQDQEDRLHRQQFMKVEVFSTNEIDISDDAQRLVKESRYMFNKLCRMFSDTENVVEIVRTPDGHDINLNGVEIGSYGVRSHMNHTWAYATGLAEPRFSTALL